MKKSCNIIIFCLCSYVCFAQQKSKPNHFNLEGSILGKESGEVYICYRDKKNAFKIDSTGLDNGHFRFSGKLSVPTIAFLTTVKKSLPEEDDEIIKADGKNTVLLFLEPASIKATLQVSDFKNAQITGSFSQTEFTEYTRMLIHVNSYYKSKYDSLQAITTLNTDQKMATKKHLESLSEQETSSITHDFITSHTASYVTAYLISCSHFKLDSMTLYYNRMPLAVKQSAYGKELKEQIEKKERVAIGKKAPLFKQVSKNGETIALKDFRGKYVLLQFWSSVNSNSRAENRALIPVFNRFKDKNFTVLGIALDGRKTQILWEAAIEKDQLPWIQLNGKSSHNKAVQEYDVETLPANFLIGPNGKIIATNLDHEHLNQLLQKETL